MDEIDERLMRIRKKIADARCGMPGHEPEPNKQLIGEIKDSVNLGRYVDVMVAALPHLNKGMVVEVSKTGRGYTVNVVPPISKLALYSLIANAAMVALLVTKIVGLW